MRKMLPGIATNSRKEKRNDKLRRQTSMLEMGGKPIKIEKFIGSNSLANLEDFLQQGAAQTTESSFRDTTANMAS